MVHYLLFLFTHNIFLTKTPSSMKNFTLTVLFAFACAFVMAQDTIANAGFENWINDGPYSDPYDWSCTNPATGAAGFYTCYQDSTVVHSGKYSALIETEYYAAFGPVPGVLTTGQINIANESVYSGEPMHSRPSGVIGWYLYLPAASDTAGVSVTLISGDSIVGTGSLNWKDSASTWTQFYCPITYSSGTIPDTAQITFNSSIAHGTKYTKLWIDDISYDYFGAGIKEAEIKTISVFPNPANNQFSIDNSNVHANVLNLFSADGTQVKSYSLNSGINNLDVTGVSAGVYVVRIIDNGGMPYTNSLVIVK
jgi:hypothetical protein